MSQPPRTGPEMPRSGASGRRRRPRGALVALPDHSPAEHEIRHADARATIGIDVPAGERLRVLKQAVLRVERLITGDQTAFNRSVVQAMRELSQRLGALETAVNAMDGTLAVLDDEMSRVDAVAADLGRAVGALERSHSDDDPAVEDEMAHARDALLQALRVVREPVGERAPRPVCVESPWAELGAASAAPASRRSGWLAVLSEGTDRRHAVLDLGCGRGDWLALLADAGIAARGVDDDAVAVAACRDRGLDAVTGDPVDHIVRLPAGRLGAVTAMHLVERLDPAGLATIGGAALRALRPGGRLIVVATDPEHPRALSARRAARPDLRPVPAGLMMALLEAAGFEAVEMRCADGTPRERRLDGEPDAEYAVVGRRSEGDASARA